MRIILNPISQVARLADTERIALAIEHAIDTRGGWHIALRRPQNLNPVREAALRLFRFLNRLLSYGFDSRRLRQIGRRCQSARRHLGAAPGIERRRIAPAFAPKSRANLLCCHKFSALSESNPRKLWITL